MSDMNDVKSALSSKTIWGGLFAFLAPIIAVVLHVTITDADTTDLADKVAAGITSVGGILAIYGRIVATKVIG